MVLAISLSPVFKKNLNKKRIGKELGNFGAPLTPPYKGSQLSITCEWSLEKSLFSGIEEETSELDEKTFSRFFSISFPATIMSFFLFS